MFWYFSWRPSLKDTSLGYTSVAAGQRSLKIPISFQLSVSLFLEWRVSKELNTSLVLNPTFGTAINKSKSLFKSNGSTISPIPLITAETPWTKNGTSLPTSRTISRFEGKSNS